MDEKYEARVERLDQYVVAQLDGESRAFAAKLIDRGDVLVNGKKEKSSYRVRLSDKIDIDYDPDKIHEIPEIDLPVIYEDDDCVVISKPLGLLSHSKGAFNPEATVASWLSTRIEGMEGDRAGIVHRLDRATSGVMICAKTPEALSWLQKQFSQRKVKKTYLAVVKGEFKEPQAVIDMPIGRNPKKPQTFRVDSNGKSALTAYKVLEFNGEYSLVELKPTTGRTHQLRVHLEELNHPIVGDTYYGGKEAERLYLHAYQLEVTLPNRSREVFTVDAPHAFKEFMAK